MGRKTQTNKIDYQLTDNLGVANNRNEYICTGHTNSRTDKGGGYEKTETQSIPELATYSLTISSPSNVCGLTSALSFDNVLSTSG